MFELFDESLELTARQKEGIGELIALWIFAIFISTAIIMIIRFRRKKQPAIRHSPNQQARPSVRKKVTH